MAAAAPLLFQSKQGFAASVPEVARKFDHSTGTSLPDGKQYGDCSSSSIPGRCQRSSTQRRRPTLATRVCPAAPEEVRMSPPGAIKTATLRWKWKPGPGWPASAHSNKSSRRETSAPDWQSHQPVPATDADDTAPSPSRLKDNARFGVRHAVALASAVRRSRRCLSDRE